MEIHNDVQTCYAKSRKEWRKWLEKNHSTEKSVWLITFLTYLSPALVLSAFAQNRDESWTQIHWIDTNKIELSLIYEGVVAVEGEEFKSYSLIWNDTIGQSMGYLKSNRPFELKVVVRTKEGIVGRYTGLSSQLTHCDFLTNSEWVSVHFWLAQNVFFDWHKYSNDSSIVFKNSYNDYRNRISFNRKEFLPIRINVQSIDNNNIVDSFDRRSVLLEPNHNIVRLFHVKEGALNPDPMPGSNGGLSAGLRQVIALDRYLVNMKSGRILLGKKWLRKYGIAEVSEMDFRVVDPQLTYTTVSGQQILGKTLIGDRRIDLKSFDPFEFETLQWSLPYSVN